MSNTCFSSHRALRHRLRSHIQKLELSRRGFHPTPALQQATLPASHNTKKWTGSLYSDSFPPTQGQAAASNVFFQSHTPHIAWVANEWRKHQPQSSTSDASTPTMLTPEIAFLGRSNSGKSSLLNALLQSPSLCRVGPKPGKTIAMHAWALSPTDPKTGGAMKGTSGDTDAKLTVLDMPGYGHGSRDEWGQEIMKYLRNRRQLKRAFVLLNPKHGIKESDEQILQMLRTNGISHQVIACKCDGVKPKELNALLVDLRAKVKEGEGRQGGMGVALDDVLAVGQLGDGSMNKKVRSDNMLGIEDVRWAVLRCVGLEDYAHKKLLEHLKRKEEILRANNWEYRVPKQKKKPALELTPEDVHQKQEALGLS